MTDKNLIALIKRRGVMWVAEQVRSRGVVPALDEGIDLSNWGCDVAPGAILFYQVTFSHNSSRGVFRSPGLGAALPYSTITSGPRVMYINSAPTPELENMVSSARSDAPVTVIYSDETQRRVEASLY